MAICTKCGVVMNDEDSSKHVCEEAEIPAKGFIKKPVSMLTELPEKIV